MIRALYPEDKGPLVFSLVLVIVLERAPPKWPGLMPGLLWSLRTGLTWDL